MFKKIYYYKFIKCSMMKKSMISAICIALVFLASSINSYAQEVDSIKVETPQSLASNKTEKNRN